jgi:hypothetical protein
MSAHTPPLKAALLLQAYKDTRNRALLALDMRWARAQAREACRVSGRTMPGDDVLLAGMHKARYECKDLPAEARHESRRWLQERGLVRLGMQAFLPDDQLPV